MKLKENLSFARYIPWKVSGQYRAYLGFPERFGHFVGLRWGCFRLSKIIFQKAYYPLTAVDIFCKQLYELCINVICLWVIYIYIYIYTFRDQLCNWRFRGCLALLWKIFFHISGIQLQPTNICFISHLLKNFQNSSFNEPDLSCYSILSRSNPREAITDSGGFTRF